MTIQLLPPLDASALLGIGPDPGAVVAAGQQNVQNELAGRSVEGNPGGFDGLFKSSLGIGPNADTIARENQAMQAQRQQQQIAAAHDAALNNPSGENYRRLFIADPEHYQATKAAFDSLNDEQQHQALQDWSAAKGYADKGDWEGYKGILQRRIDADQKAGQPTADDEHMLALADDPAGQARIGANVGYHLAAALGPEKYNEAFAADQKADQLTLDTAKLAEETRHNQFEENKPTLTVAPAGDHVYQVGGQKGAAAPATADFDAIYGAFTKPHEGGYTAQDGNGAPANFGINQKANPDIDVRKLTPDQAKRILHDRYWTLSGADQLPGPLAAVQFDSAVNMGVGTAKQLLAQSGGDVGRYLDLREQRYRGIAAANPKHQADLNNWLTRNADLRAYALGGPNQGVTEIQQPSGKSGWRPSTPEEIASVHLPPNTPAQTSPEGKVEPLPGTSVNLKVLPASVGLAIADRRQVLSKIDRALAFVHARPQDVGVIGYVPDPILQRMDPDGANTRAAVGDIGSQIIHDRSGAAVTFSEMPRLKPFVPTAKDSADTVVTKLNRLRENVSGELGSMLEEFGPDSGYRQPGGSIDRAADASKPTPKGTTNWRPGPGGQFPVFTRDQALSASKNPNNRGKQFYIEGADGLQAFH